MQAFIIHTNRVKDEDLLVTLLTHQNIKTTYRFYGARHSTVQLGYKIDCEIVSSLKSALPQLRSIVHLAHAWEFERERMLIWQSFIRLLYLHLKDVAALDAFYYTLLEKASNVWHKQNPKRIAIEAYVHLLRHEGRLHEECICFRCEQIVKERLSLVRAFLPAHHACVWGDTFDPSAISILFETASSIHLEDSTIERLWKIMQEGL